MRTITTAAITAALLLAACADKAPEALPASDETMDDAAPSASEARTPGNDDRTPGNDDRTGNDDRGAGNDDR